MIKTTIDVIKFYLFHFVGNCRRESFEEYKKAMINNNHIPPAKKKIGASLNNLTEKILLAVGIKPKETKVIPERYAS